MSFRSTGPRILLFTLLAMALGASPNPFHNVAAIDFALPVTGHVSLRVYDVTGRLVRTLQNGPLEAGRHVRVWNRGTEGGSLAPPGVYFARLESLQGALTRKVIMVK